VDKKVCPICSKTLSYSKGVFSKHGYQIRFHQHTPSLCFGAYQKEDGLIEKYIEAMEGWLDNELKNFPNEWLDLSATSYEQRQHKQEYAAFRSAKELIREIKYFKNKLDV
jgi:hypothetical protein